MVLLLQASLSSAAEPVFVPEIRKLMEILCAHPQLEARSIDSFEPKGAKPFEREFYENG